MDKKATHDPGLTFFSVAGLLVTFLHSLTYACLHENAWHRHFSTTQSNHGVDNAEDQLHTHCWQSKEGVTYRRSVGSVSGVSLLQPHTYRSLFP